MKKQKVLTGILTAFMLCAFTAFGFAGCKDDNASASLPETPVVPPVVQEPAYDGVILKDGETYSLCANAAFLGADVVTTSETGDVEFMPVAATFTATVEPSDAPQNVTWAVAFVNPSSDWAKGKTATDYVTVDLVDESVSTEIRTVCRKPFGEQIKLICTSVQNPSVTAECVLDFVQSPQNVALTFGDDLPINLGGVTPLYIEVNPNGDGVGGSKNVVIDTYDAYTIADTFTYQIDLLSPYLYYHGNIPDYESVLTEYVNPFIANQKYNDGAGEYASFYNDGYFKLNLTEEDTSFRQNWNDGYVMGNLDISDLYLNHHYISHSGMMQSRPHAHRGFGFVYTSDESNCDFSAKTGGLANLYTTYSDKFVDGVWSDCIEEGSMWTLRLTLTGTYKTFEYISLLELEGFTNNPIAKSITLSASDYKF